MAEHGYGVLREPKQLHRDLEHWQARYKSFDNRSGLGPALGSCWANIQLQPWSAMGRPLMDDEATAVLRTVCETERSLHYTARHPWQQRSIQGLELYRCNVRRKHGNGNSVGK